MERKPKENKPGNDKPKGKTKKKDAALPLVVCDESGAFLFLSSTNRKGYNKSIEQGSLWIAHPKTGRILPCGQEGKFLLIQERDDYFYAEIAVSAGAPKETSVPAAGGKKKAATAPAHTVSSKGKAVPGLEPNILTNLAALIAQRKKEQPEGSYTTYLFRSGADKIRKKTGEEAVELILARTKDEMIYEAADLLYHLLVLLEAEEVGLPSVLAELASRK